ncbi:MAG: NYN domain-containing protein [Clostridia bacterium]|nr:NYN domain-containing protein [Clostridia bacterium]
MRTVAVLIDAENVQASFGDKVFSYANSLGNVIVKEIYGVASALGLWVEPVLKYAIHPNLTIKASKFKNTSDISLVIGAMDLLLAGEVDTVIIVSSDSDFSTLSVRLRSAGLEVIGMGTEKVNPLWRTACSSFVILSAQAPQRPVAYTVKPPEPEEVPVIKAQKTEEKAVIVPITKPVAVQTPDNVSRPVSEQEQKTAALKKQGTPVVVLPESAKLAGNAAAAQPKQPRPRAAVTHSDRTAAIRSLITKHLEMNGGKMSITNIFHALNSLPDYHVDQQGSKRKPLNYLMWLFGDVFAFEDGMIMFPELSKGAKLKGEQQADRANKDEPEGVKKLLPGAVPTAPEAEKSESGDAPAANLSVPGKVIPVQAPTMTAEEKTNNAEPVKRIGASPDQNLTAAAEKKAKERHAETAAAKPAEKVMTPAAKQIPTVETAAEKAEKKRTETVVTEQAEKQMNPAVEQNPAAETAAEKTKEQPAEAATSEQTEKPTNPAAEKAEEKRTETVVLEQPEKQMNPAVEQNPVVETAAEQAEKQLAEPAASERTEKQMNSDVEQNPAAETAAEKAEKQPVEAVVPEQPEKQMSPAVEQIPVAETAAEQAEKQPAETVAPEQAEKQMNPAAEQNPVVETPAEKTEKQPAEAATPEQAEKQMNPVAEQNPTAETAAEKTEEPRTEVTASEQAEKQMNPAAEQTPAAEAVAEQTEEQRAEARTSEQAEKATNPAAEQAPAAESAAEKAEDHPQKETVKSQSEATTVPAQTEVSSAEKAEAKPAEDGKAVKPEKPAEAAPENKPAGKPRDTERGKKAASTESEKRSGKKDGNRHGASGKKQNEPRGNGKTSAEEKSKDEQNKRAPQTAADQTSQEKHPADEKGNSKEKNVPPKQNGTPERSGSKNEPKDNHNRKTASNAQDEARNAALENTTLDKIGIQPRPVKILMDNGYRTLADVARVRDGDLLRIKGIGKTTVDLIRLSVKKAAEKE